jgi:hypothetical protein
MYIQLVLVCGCAGIGQGSTIGPFLWLLCFCLITDALGSTCPKMTFVSPNRNVSVSSTGDAFVDDSFLGVTSSHSSNSNSTFPESQWQHTTSVLTNLEELSQKWERLLFTTGGAINLSKSFWILVDWHWKQGVAVMRTPELTSYSLLLTEGYNVEHPIKEPQLSP